MKKQLSKLLKKTNETHRHFWLSIETNCIYYITILLLYYCTVYWGSISPYCVLTYMFKDVCSRST